MVSGMRRPLTRTIDQVGRRSWPVALAAAIGLLAPVGLLVPPAWATVTGPVVKVCDAAHLNAAVAAAPQGSTVTFACDGTIRIKSVDDVVEVTGTDSGPRALAIDGYGHRVTIDGNETNHMVFLAPGSSLGLANLTFAHGANSESVGAGAIDSWGHLTVDTVRFEKNAAVNSGGALRNYGHGSLEVHNSTFVGNQSTCVFLLGGGGAIEQNSTGPLTITNSVFRDNAAIGVGVGGAIYAHADTFGVHGNGIPRGLLMGPVTISDSQFTHNAAAATFDFDDNGLQGGGAIWSAGVDVTIDNTRFASNEANFSGGAIRFFGSIGNPTGLGLGPRHLRVSNSAFGSNVAHDWPLPPPFGSIPGRGGGIAAGSFSPPEVSTNIDPVTILGSTFTSNIARAGSAIGSSEPLYLSGSKLAFLLLINTTAEVGETKVVNNVGSGCATFQATIVDKGGNVEKPGNTCGFSSRT